MSSNTHNSAMAPWKEQLLDYRLLHERQGRRWYSILAALSYVCFRKKQAGAEQRCAGIGGGEKKDTSSSPMTWKGTSVEIVDYPKYLYDCIQNNGPPKSVLVKSIRSNVREGWVVSHSDLRPCRDNLSGTFIVDHEMVTSVGKKAKRSYKKCDAKFKEEGGRLMITELKVVDPPLQQTTDWIRIIGQGEICVIVEGSNVPENLLFYPPCGTTPICVAFEKGHPLVNVLDAKDKEVVELMKVVDKTYPSVKLALIKAGITVPEKVGEVLATHLVPLSDPKAVDDTEEATRECQDGDSSDVTSANFWDLIHSRWKEFMENDKDLFKTNIADVLDFSNTTRLRGPVIQREVIGCIEHLEQKLPELHQLLMNAHHPLPVTITDGEQKLVEWVLNEATYAQKDKVMDFVNHYLSRSLGDDSNEAWVDWWNNSVMTMGTSSDGKEVTRRMFGVGGLLKYFVRLGNDQVKLEGISVAGLDVNIQLFLGSQGKAGYVTEKPVARLSLDIPLNAFLNVTKYDPIERYSAEEDVIIINGFHIRIKEYDSHDYVVKGDVLPCSSPYKSLNEMIRSTNIKTWSIRMIPLCIPDILLVYSPPPNSEYVLVTVPPSIHLPIEANKKGASMDVVRYDEADDSSPVLVRFIPSQYEILIRGTELVDCDPRMVRVPWPITYELGMPSMDSSSPLRYFSLEEQDRNDLQMLVMEHEWGFAVEPYLNDSSSPEGSAYELVNDMVTRHGTNRINALGLVLVELLKDGGGPLDARFYGMLQYMILRAETRVIKKRTGVTVNLKYRTPVELKDSGNRLKLKEKKLVYRIHTSDEKRLNLIIKDGDSETPFMIEVSAPSRREFAFQFVDSKPEDDGWKKPPVELFVETLNDVTVQGAVVEGMTTSSGGDTVVVKLDGMEYELDSSHITHTQYDIHKLRALRSGSTPEAWEKAVETWIKVDASRDDRITAEHLEFYRSQQKCLGAFIAGEIESIFRASRRFDSDASKKNKRGKKNKGDASIEEAGAFMINPGRMDGFLDYMKRHHGEITSRWQSTHGNGEVNSVESIASLIETVRDHRAFQVTTWENAPWKQDLTWSMREAQKEAFVAMASFYHSECRYAGSEARRSRASSSPKPFGACVLDTGLGKSLLGLYVGCYCLGNLLRKATAFKPLKEDLKMKIVVVTLNKVVPQFHRDVNLHMTVRQYQHLMIDAIHLGWMSVDKNKLPQEGPSLRHDPEITAPELIRRLFVTGDSVGEWAADRVQDFCSHVQENIVVKRQQDFVYSDTVGAETADIVHIILDEMHQFRNVEYEKSDMSHLVGDDSGQQKTHQKRKRAVVVSDADVGSGVFKKIADILFHKVGGARSFMGLTATLVVNHAKELTWLLRNSTVNRFHFCVQNSPQPQMNVLHVKCPIPSKGLAPYVISIVMDKTKMEREDLDHQKLYTSTINANKLHTDDSRVKIPTYRASSLLDGLFKFPMVWSKLSSSDPRDKHLVFFDTYIQIECFIKYIGAQQSSGGGPGIDQVLRADGQTNRSHILETIRLFTQNDEFRILILSLATSTGMDIRFPTPTEPGSAPRKIWTHQVSGLYTYAEMYQLVGRTRRGDDDAAFFERLHIRYETVFPTEWKSDVSSLVEYPFHLDKKDMKWKVRWNLIGEPGDKLDDVLDLSGDSTDVTGVSLDEKKKLGNKKILESNGKNLNAMKEILPRYNIEGGRSVVITKMGKADQNIPTVGHRDLGVLQGNEVIVHKNVKVTGVTPPTKETGATWDKDVGAWDPGAMEPIEQDPDNLQEYTIDGEKKKVVARFYDDKNQVHVFFKPPVYQLYQLDAASSEDLHSAKKVGDVVPEVRIVTGVRSEDSDMKRQKRKNAKTTTSTKQFQEAPDKITLYDARRLGVVDPVCGGALLAMMLLDIIGDYIGLPKNNEEDLRNRAQRVVKGISTIDDTNAGIFDVERDILSAMKKHGIGYEKAYQSIMRGVSRLTPFDRHVLSKLKAQHEKGEAFSIPEAIQEAKAKAKDSFTQDQIRALWDMEKSDYFTAMDLHPFRDDGIFGNEDVTEESLIDDIGSSRTTLLQQYNDDMAKRSNATNTSEDIISSWSFAYWLLRQRIEKHREQTTPPPWDDSRIWGLWDSFEAAEAGINQIRSEQDVPSLPKSIAKNFEKLDHGDTDEIRFLLIKRKAQRAFGKLPVVLDVFSKNNSDRLVRLLRRCNSLGTEWWSGPVLYLEGPTVNQTFSQSQTILVNQKQNIMCHVENRLTTCASIPSECLETFLDAITKEVDEVNNSKDSTITLCRYKEKGREQVQEGEGDPVDQTPNFIVKTYGELKCTRKRGAPDVTCKGTTI